MLTCITCKPKIEDDGREDGGTRGTPETVKSLTAQIKEIAVKVSGAYKCKSSIPTGSCRKGQRPNPDFDALTSEAIPFPYQPGSSGSTPAWDFTNAGHSQTPRPGSRFAGARAHGSVDPVIQFGGVEEWTAQVEPGIQITFVSLPQGGNDLRRIRFSRDMYDKWEAQRWWGENYDRIMELYNVQKFNQQEAPSTPSQSENGRDSCYSRLGSSSRESPIKMMTPALRNCNNNKPPPPPIALPDHKNGEMCCMDASRTTTESRDDADASISISNASEMESEWVEQDQPGVYITIRQLADGTRELRRVRFSCCSYLTHTAEKDLERCMQRAGGSRTEREYKLNTFERHYKLTSLPCISDG
nr:protein BREVIS RADIX-like [Ipomoea batatas]